MLFIFNVAGEYENIGQQKEEGTSVSFSDNKVEIPVAVKQKIPELHRLNLTFKKEVQQAEGTT